MTPNASLLISDAHGMYIPQLFATGFNWDIPPELQEDFDIIRQGPDHEEYWDAWYNITNNFEPCDDNCKRCGIYQQGDLWMIPLDEYELLDELSI